MAKKKSAAQVKAAIQQTLAKSGTTSSGRVLSGGQAQAAGDAAFARFMSSQGGPAPSQGNLFQQGIAKLAPLFQTYDAFSGAGAARTILGNAITGTAKGASQSLQNTLNDNPRASLLDVLPKEALGALAGYYEGGLSAAKRVGEDYSQISGMGMARLAANGKNPLAGVANVYDVYGKAPGMQEYLRKFRQDFSITAPNGETANLNDLQKFAKQQQAQGKTSMAENALLAASDVVSNPWFDRILGFGLDVATDPGTYLTAGVEGSAKTVAAKLAAEGMDNAAAKVLRYGVSALSSEELAAIGEKGGLRFAGVQVLPHDVTAIPGKATAGIRAKVGDKLLNEGVYKYLGKTADFEHGNPRIAMRSGIAEQAVPAFKATRATEFQNAVTRRAFHEVGRDFGQAFHDAGKAGWKNHNDIVKWLETADQVAKDGLAAGRATEPLVRIQESFKKVADFIEAATGVRPQVQDYFPRLYVGPIQRTKQGVAKAFDTLAGRLKPGDLYLGEVIPQTDSAGVRAFIEQTAKDKLGAKYTRVFSDNPVEALSAYLAGVEKSVAKAKRVEDVTRIAGSGVGKVAADTLGKEGVSAGVLDNAIQAIVPYAEKQRALLDQVGQVWQEGTARGVGFADKKTAKAFERDVQSLQDLRAKVAAGDVRPEILQAKTAAEQKVSQALKRLEQERATAARTIDSQIATLKRKAANTKIAAKREMYQQQLDALISSRDRLIERGASRAVGVVNKAQSEAAQLTEMVRNFKFRQNVVAGWNAKISELESKLGLSAGADIPRTRVSYREEALGLLRDARDVAVKAEGEIVDQLRAVGLTEARAKATWADLLESSGGKMLALDKVQLSKEQMAEIGRNMENQLRQIVQEMGPQTLPSDLVELATGVSKKLGRVDEFFARHWDPMMNWLKARQIATPGFSLRNLQGGAFNNWLAGVKASSYPQFLGLYWGNEAKLANASKLDQLIFGEIKKSLSLAETQAAAEIRGGQIAKGGNWRFWSSDFKPFHAMKVFNEHIESDVLRGTMMWDTFKKDGELARLVARGDQRAIEGRLRFLHESAMDRVAKFHFDYADLSRLETGVVRRIIPFYTFSRFNLPLQVEMLARHPEKFVRTNRALQNLGAGVPQDQVVPQYFGDIGATPTPFTADGSRVYYAPDLPFNQALDFYSNPTDYVASMVTPLIKTPIEMKLGTQFYKGIPLTNEMKPVPAWGKIPGLMPALQAVGVADKGANGKYFMADKDQYLVEQFLPDLARVRRMAPSDTQTQSKVTAAWISTVLGIRTRINTPAEQQAELDRQKYAGRDQKALDKKYKKSGYKA